jgi:2-polyprenyl-3-methyl-5-hydroxy-6-metoxy-1,4-benzoquinol methylase
VLLYWPYPTSDDNLPEGSDAPGPSADVLAWYSKSSFYNHTNFTNMLRFTMGESFKGRHIDVLDYGGGGGQFALVCKSHYPEATVHITDIDDHALLDEWKPLNVHIPFHDFRDDRRTFDVIFVNDVFEHVREPLFVLNQLSGKLKPRGRIFIDTPRQFWIYPATRLLSTTLYAKVLRGTVSRAHLQIWSRPAFELVVQAAGLSIHKYAEVSEFTMPGEFYFDNMGVTNRLMRRVGRLFYRSGRYVAKNKIMCVLS